MHRADISYFGFESDTIGDHYGFDPAPVVDEDPLRHRIRGEGNTVGTHVCAVCIDRALAQVGVQSFNLLALGVASIVKVVRRVTSSNRFKGQGPKFWWVDPPTYAEIEAMSERLAMRYAI